MPSDKLYSNSSKENILQYLSCSSLACSDPTADVMIHCSDGVLAGHRLVLASISRMLHAALLGNPAEDLTVVMMPDFSLDQVTSYLQRVYRCEDVQGFQDINTTLGYRKENKIQNLGKRKMEINEPESLKTIIKLEDEEIGKFDKVEEYSEDGGKEEGEVKSSQAIVIPLMQNPHKRSNVHPVNKTPKEVWDNLFTNHFIKDEETGKCECRHCGKILSKSTSKWATKLSDHIRKIHKNIDMPPGPETRVQTVLDPESGELMKKKRKSPAVQKKSKSKTFFEKHITQTSSEGEVKQWACNHCGRTFTFHISQHNGSFKHENIERHLMTHQIYRPNVNAEQLKVQCDLCGKELKGCNLKQKLKNHIKATHDRVKDLHCDMCDYKTYKSGNMYLHVRKMHGGMSKKWPMRQCPHCPAMPAAVELSRHIKMHHPSLM